MRRGTRGGPAIGAQQARVGKAAADVSAAPRFAAVPHSTVKPIAAYRMLNYVFMPGAADRADGRSAADAQAAIERFLKSSRQPALLEPGEDILPLAAGNFVLEIRGSRLVLQAWDRTRNLVRRVGRIKTETRGRLELVVERFARREGSLFLI